MALAGLVALLTAGCLLLARLFRLGFLADFLSQTVLVGFLTGVGFQVGIAMLGEMLGVAVDIQPHAWNSSRRSSAVCRSVHLPTLVRLRGGRGDASSPAAGSPRVCPARSSRSLGRLRRAPRSTSPAHGIAVIGPVAGGLPRIGLPDVTWGEIPPLLPVAASCFLMIVAQSAATARAYASRHRQTLDEDTDLVGLSAANAAAALSGTFVVNGSPTQTAMVERSGGRSQLAHLATAAVVAIVLLFLTGPLQYLPRCVLGAHRFHDRRRARRRARPAQHPAREPW